MTNLPKATEPLILPDGTKIDPVSGKVVREDVEIVEIPSRTEAQALVTKTRRTIADLPNAPSMMNPINIVLCYDLFGMSDQQIAVATGLSIEQVQAIKGHEAYGKMRSSVRDAVVSETDDQVVDLLSRGRVRAARKLYTLVDDQDPDIALKAAAQIMLHSKDNKTNDGMDGMEIKIVRRNANQEMPNIILQL